MSSHPEPGDYAYNLEGALAAVVAVRSRIPSDAFTADTLGTERGGNGVVIRSDGIVLTIGYLITEAESVWLSFNDGSVVPGHVIGQDQETGFGLIQALSRVQVPALQLGSSASVKVGDPVVVAGAGGRQHAVAGQVVARQEFAGYWEYLLDEALFTAPAHQNWGGAAVIDEAGKLIGVGSLSVQQVAEGNEGRDINMVVPIDLLKPILDDMLSLGRTRRPARPWLGVYATEVGGRVVIAGLSNRGPARKADLRVGDVVLRVGSENVTNLTTFFRSIWSRGDAGVTVPITVHRSGRTLEVNVASVDRRSLLKGPVLH
ncbi:MAG: S1C family serine protease [Hyphomicrobiaceae bacterium]